MTTKLEEAQQAIDAALAKIADNGRERDVLLEQRETKRARLEAIAAAKDNDAALERVSLESQIAALNARLGRLGDELRELQQIDLARAETRRRQLVNDRDTLRANIKSAESLLTSGMHDAEITQARQRLAMLELGKAQFVRDTKALYERLSLLAGEEEAAWLASKHGRVLP